MDQVNNKIFLFHDGDYAKSVLTGLRKDYLQNEGFLLDLCADDLHEQIKDCAEQVNASVYSAFESALRINLLCVAAGFDNFSRTLALFKHIKKIFTAVYMDVLVVGQNTESPAWLSAFNDLPHGFCVYYIRRQIHTGALLTEHDVRNIAYDMLNGRIGKANRYSGLYLIRVASGSIRRFALFEELAARRLEDIPPIGTAADPNRIRDYIVLTVNGHIRHLNKESFHYVLWDDARFTGGRYTTATAQMTPLFNAYLERFVRMNCAGRFDEYMEKEKQNRDETAQRFINHIVCENADGVFGEQWIALLDALLDGLYLVRSEWEKEKTGRVYTPSEGANKYNRLLGGISNLWDYADYLYETVFKHKMATVQIDCCLELTALLIELLENLIETERRGFEQLKTALRENRDTDNKFTGEVCGHISELFKENPEANAYLIKQMRYFINHAQVERNASRLDSILFADSFSTFLKLLSDASERIFTQSSVNQFNARVQKSIDEQFQQPVLLLHESFDRVKNLLKLSEPDTRSFMTNRPRLTDASADLFLSCEYFHIKLEDGEVTDAFRRILEVG